MYPNVLIKIADFLRNHEGELVEKGAGDGRTASTLAESSIITLLKNNGFRVESTDNRAWCDFVVEQRYKKSGEKLSSRYAETLSGIL